MKKYDKILVLENDSARVPGHLENVLRHETVDIEYWYDFSMSFYWNKDDAFKRLMDVPDTTLLVCAPSFVGPGNTLEEHMRLFQRLIPLGKKVNIAIIYPSNFYMMLLAYMADNNVSHLKKQNNIDTIREVLTIHNVHEIPYTGDYGNNKISNSDLITYGTLLPNYLETNKKIGRTSCQVIATGEIHEVYSVYYGKSIEETEVVLYIEDQPNNKFNLSQILKLK